MFEIIFQARFPDILKIPDETPLDFQSVMRDQGYPNFNINASPVQDIFKPDLGGLTEFLNTYIMNPKQNLNDIIGPSRSKKAQRQLRQCLKNIVNENNGLRIMPSPNQ